MGPTYSQNGRVFLLPFFQNFEHKPLCNCVNLINFLKNLVWKLIILSSFKAVAQIVYGISGALTHVCMLSLFFCVHLWQCRGWFGKEHKINNMFFSGPEHSLNLAILFRS